MRRRLQEPSEQDVSDAMGSVDTLTANDLFYNYVRFSLCYSIVHATVDSVLAFSSAELGTTIGSKAGFTLYLVYSFSCLLVAKPILSIFESKKSVLIGLFGLLLYVCSFYAALGAGHPSNVYIFVTGATVAGLGSGVLWTAQSSYYAINANQYAEKSGTDPLHANNNFAAIFAAFYLSLETGFKLLATTVYFIQKEDSADNTSWKTIIFSFYSIAAVLAVIAFSLLVRPLVDSSPNTISRNSEPDSLHVIESNPSPFLNPSTDDIQHSAVPSDLDRRRASDEEDLSGQPNHGPQAPRPVSWDLVFEDVGAVYNAIRNSPILGLMVPYQICFGLAIVFVSNYFLGVIVADSIGDGYIGLISGLTTLSAISLAWPFAYISNNYINGKYMIMMLGGCCFLFEGITLLLLSEKAVKTWGFIIVYSLVHGCGRGVWENTNKAVISEYFQSPRVRNAAFASIYFTSGLAGALGYLLYQVIDREMLLLINTASAIMAMVCYDRGYKMFRAQEARELLDEADYSSTGGGSTQTSQVLLRSLSVSSSERENDL